MQAMKTCTKCKQELPATSEYYSKDRSKLIGIRNICKKCVKQYRKDNAEKIKHRQKQYNSDNSEKIKEYRKQYDKDNLSKSNEYKKQWKIKNLERIKIQRKHWKVNTHPEKSRIYNHRCKATSNRLACDFTFEQWNNTKQHFDNCCAYCGKEKYLEQDHFVPVSKSGGYTISNIIPACKDCNNSKYNKDFCLWYPSYKHYNKEREERIYDFIKKRKRAAQVPWIRCKELRKT